MAYNRPLDSMSISELKAELRTYVAKVSGRKQDLCDRLQFYRDNKHAVPLEPEYRMILPDINQYKVKDIHTGMITGFPEVNISRLEEYLQQLNKPLDTGKIVDFYKQRFLRLLRAAPGPNGSVFLTAVMWAEMKKSVSYKVDVLLEASGVIDEAQCECGAGQGPEAHCKHVCTVVYGTVCFLQEEKILTEITCTQILQSFHHSKPHKGSPLKLTGISLPRKRQRTDSQPNGRIQYDPRRDCDKNLENYNSELRSLCVNYQANFGGSMPVMHLVSPANLHGLFVDHDYLQYDAAYQFLLDSKLISIDEEDITYIESLTRKQSKCKEWKKVREIRLTASNFGKISKGTGKQNKEKLVLSLLSSSHLKTKAIDHGLKYESVAVKKYEQMYKTNTNECGFFISKHHPVLGATPDRVVDNNLIVEVKCPYAARNQNISPQTVPYLILNSQGNLELKRNHDYFYQVQGQLYCSGRSSCDFIVYTSKDIKVIRIEIDITFIQGMVEKLLDFHEEFHKNALISKFVYKDYYNYSF